nr:hypothetical protein [Sinorhizobium arboris]
MIGELRHEADHGMAGNAVKPHRLDPRRQVDDESVKTRATRYCPADTEQDDRVVSLSAIKSVVAARARQEVIAGAGIEKVIAFTAIEIVIADQAPQPVGLWSAAQAVVTSCSNGVRHDRLPSVRWSENFSAVAKYKSTIPKEQLQISIVVVGI